jgi:hypothetical protein
MRGRKHWFPCYIHIVMVCPVSNAAGLQQVVVWYKDRCMLVLQSGHDSGGAALQLDLISGTPF